MAVSDDPRHGGVDFAAPRTATQHAFKRGSRFVFGGMLVATFVSVVTVPMLYFVIQVISEKLGGRGVVDAEAEAGTGAEVAEAAGR